MCKAELWKDLVIGSSAGSRDQRKCQWQHHSGVRNPSTELGDGSVNGTGKYLQEPAPPQPPKTNRPGCKMRLNPLVRGHVPPGI